MKDKSVSDRNSNINKCKSPDCSYDIYDDRFCILHSENPGKNIHEFIKQILTWIEDHGFEFEFISFPHGFIMGSIKSGIMTFTSCYFHCEVNLQERNFHDIKFIACKFHNSCNFNKSKFSGKSIFLGCNFKSSASFRETSLPARTFFSVCEFELGCDFYNAYFAKGLIFDRCSIGTSYFFLSNIESVRFDSCSWNSNFILAEEQYSTKINSKHGKIGFPDNYLNKFLSKVLQLKLLNKGSEFILRILFSNEYERQKKFKEHGVSIYIEHTGWNELFMAERTYRELKKIYSDQGEHDIAGNFFFREKSVQRRQKKPFMRIINYWLNERLFGFGEKIGRLLLNMIAVIVLYTLGFYNFDLIYREGMDYVGIWNSLYFSAVTFTSLGYGDFEPTGIGRFLAFSEALIGAILMGLFVVTLTRRLIR